MRDESYLTVDDVARLTRSKPKTVLNRRSKGLGPRGFRLGRVVLFRREDVERYLQDQQDADVIGARSACGSTPPGRAG